MIAWLDLTLTFLRSNCCWTTLRRLLAVFSSCLLPRSLQSIKSHAALCPETLLGPLVQVVALGQENPNDERLGNQTLISLAARDKPDKIRANRLVQLLPAKNLIRVPCFSKWTWRMACVLFKNQASINANIVQSKMQQFRFRTSSKIILLKKDRCLKSILMLSDMRSTTVCSIIRQRSKKNQKTLIINCSQTATGTLLAWTAVSINHKIEWT